MFRGGFAPQQWIFLARADAEDVETWRPLSSIHQAQHMSLYFVLFALYVMRFFFFFFHILAGNLKAVRIGNASEMFSRGNEIHVTRAARRKKKNNKTLQLRRCC